MIAAHITTASKTEIGNILDTDVVTKLPGLMYMTHDGIWINVVYSDNGLLLEFDGFGVTAPERVAAHVLAWVRYEDGLTDERPEYEPYEIDGVIVAE